MRTGLSTLLLILLGCQSPKGSWRDQQVFVGDDGTVVPMGVMRHSSGAAEAKGWVGLDGSWRMQIFHRFATGRSDPSDAAAALRALSKAGKSRLRASLERRGNALDLGVRTPSARLRLHSTDMTPVGQSTDPEGVSVYSAGRAKMELDNGTREGWLLAESTPRNKPHRFVDYGDFASVVLATPGGELLFAKRSRNRPGFDHAWIRRDGRSLQTRTVQIDANGDHLTVRLPELNLHWTLQTRARHGSDGRNPAGEPVRYETLLLSGQQAGVAFVTKAAGGTR